MKLKNVKSQALIATKSSVPADSFTRDKLKQLARNHQMSMTDYLEKLVGEAERCDKRGEKMRAALKVEDMTSEEQLAKIYQMVEKSSKQKSEKDVIVAFFRKQEADLLKPLLAYAETISTKLDKVIEGLESIDKKKPKVL